MVNIIDAISNLELKEMEGSLLNYAILRSVRLMDSVDASKVEEALELASYLHRHDTRANRANLPRDTYITHPYRNTLRIIRYGCEDQDVIIASILHDTVEDHYEDIVKEFLEESTEELSIQELMDKSIAWYAETFSEKVAHIVNAVSNPPLPKTLSKEEKRKLYAEHVLGEISDGDVFIVKFSDFVDNAVGLHHNLGSTGMVGHLSQKYIQLVPGFRHRLHEDTHNRQMCISDQGLDEMKRHLDLGEKRLQKMLDTI